MGNDARVFFAKRAWLDGWRDDVLLRVDENGHWSEVTPGAACPPEAEILAGPALPGMVNAHSHAFQRAFAGLAEYRTEARDDFWTWRDRMYRVAMKINPEQMRVVAAQLYRELLLGGYTQVCEFHYLHRTPEGHSYDDHLAMSWALADAANDAGIGMTLIPVIYERAGFDQPLLRDEQRPFTMNAFQAWSAYEEIRDRRQPLVTAAIGAHSLRAVRPESMLELRRLTEHYSDPIHIHVAEQTGEVEMCLKTSGKRPLEWLCSEEMLDSRWHLVHCTHTTPAELDALAKSGASVVLCPNTEANLGDGVGDAPGMLARGISIAIGSDSQIARDWPNELRMLEYAQRLRHRQRCVTASPPHSPSTGERLFSLPQTGGAKAAGFANWGFTSGARADLIVLDESDPALLGIAKDCLLDALIFSAPARPIRDVLVAGQWQVREGRHASMDATEFRAAMRELWS